MEQVNITNKTMELAECASEWSFDEKYRCWCLEDVLYTEKATTPKFQRLSIFVPEPYMSEGGKINLQGRMNGYSAKVRGAMRISIWREALYTYPAETAAERQEMKTGSSAENHRLIWWI